MNTHDPQTAYTLGMSGVDERLEQRQLEREVRAARPTGMTHAVRRKLSVLLARLSGWVHPGPESRPAMESALIRLVR